VLIGFSIFGFFNDYAVDYTSINIIEVKSKSLKLWVKGYNIRSLRKKMIWIYEFT